MRVLLVCFLALALFGCNTKQTPTDPPPKETSTTDEKAEKPDIEEVKEPLEFDARLSLREYPFEVRTFPIEAQRQQLEMAYMDVAADKPNGETVVLLHGKNFSGEYWERTAKDLSAMGYRVVIPDQIGFGKSSKPMRFQYSFEALAYNTRALLDSLGIENATVVGHSMGGMLASRFALMYPEFTQRLILVNPIGLEDWQEKVPYQPVDVWYANELKKTPEKVKAYMQASYFDGKWKPEYDALAKLQAEWSQSRDREQVAWASALTYDMIFTQPVVHEFPRITSPTLLIIGTRDRTALGKNLVSPEVKATMGLYEELGKRTRDAIPGAKLVELPGIGHIPQYEAYDDYIAAMSGFLEETAPAAE